MLIFKRFLVFSLPLLIFLSFFWLFFQPQWYYYLFLLNILIIIFNLWYLIGRKTILNDFLNFLFTPLFFISGSFILYTFLENSLIKTILLFLIPIAVFIFYNKIFFEFYKKPIWQLKSFKYLIYYFQLFSLWFLASSFFGLIIFINFSAVIASGLLLIFLIIFFNQFSWSEELSQEEKAWLTFLIFLVTFLESIIILNLLPLSFYFKGLILTVVYYLFCQGFLLTKQSSLGVAKYFINKFFIIILIIFLTWLFSNYIF